MTLYCFTDLRSGLRRNGRHKCRVVTWYLMSENLLLSEPRGTNMGVLELCILRWMLRQCHFFNVVGNDELVDEIADIREEVLDLTIGCFQGDLHITCIVLLMSKPTSKIATFFARTGTVSLRRICSTTQPRICMLSYVEHVQRGRNAHSAMTRFFSGKESHNVFTL